VKYRRLPRTNLTLPEVGFGVWTVATNWWGRIEESDRLLLLEQAFDLGVNFFDTADTYGEGYGEEVLAKALGKERHNIIISTKFGYDFYDKTERVGHSERPQKFEPDFIRYACDQSLKRLNTDYIDLYQLHNPRIDTLENDEVFDTLNSLVKEGKIRHYGAALGPDIGWFEEGEAAMRDRQVSSLQIVYSILEQDPGVRMFPIAEEQNVGLLARVPHASDVLSGKLTEVPTFSPGDHRSHRKHDWLISALKEAARVKFLANETGRTMAQAAIKFCLAKSSVISVLPNFTNIEELQEYTSATETPDLSDREQDSLEELWKEASTWSEMPRKGKESPEMLQVLKTAYQ
jgi:aryl-alcohol dehydrogenase-like predicted oxidoreductase